MSGHYTGTIVLFWSCLCLLSLVWMRLSKFFKYTQDEVSYIIRMQITAHTPPVTYCLVCMSYYKSNFIYLCAPTTLIFTDTIFTAFVNGKFPKLFQPFVLSRGGEIILSAWPELSDLQKEQVMRFLKTCCDKCQSPVTKASFDDTVLLMAKHFIFI